DVEPDAAAGIDGEMVEGVGELEAAAGDPGMTLAAQLERLIAGDRQAGLVEAAFAGINDAREDQRLRLRAAVDEAGFDPGNGEAPLRRTHLAWASRRAWVRRWKRQVSKDAEAAKPSAKPHHTPTAP